MKLPLLKIPKPQTRAEWKDRCFGVSRHPELNESSMAVMGCSSIEELRALSQKFERIKAPIDPERN
jgi:hypothetical protein